MTSKKRTNKKQNLRLMRGTYYYRLTVWNSVHKSRKELAINLKTKKKDEAIARGKQVEKYERDIQDGIVQKFQFKTLFPFLNDEGTSELIKKSLQETMDDYLEYRNVMVKPATLKRDKSALNQFRRFVGSSKAVEELSYRDIEGANGLIQHLRNKGCSDVGINTSLRHIRTYLNWLFEKEKLIPEPIKFKELKEGVQLYHYFNESEINQIYHYINEHMDSSYLRYFHFYNQTGMRPTEPFIGELVGDWYLISGEDRKNGIPMQMQLNEELKSILLEMQSFRDTKLHCKDANVRVVDILERNIMKIVRALELTGKRLTLYSFRHSCAIRRVTMTDIFTVQRELGHKSTDMTQKYLRFPEQRRLDDFPSLKQYIENRQNMQKDGSMVTKSMVTEYSNIPKLIVSIRL